MDCGGSNSYRSRVFKLRLARFVEGKNFKIEAHHYPPGTSKYNPIEHRMFPHCSRALQGQILLSEQCIQELLSDAKTNVGSLGLRVKAFIVDKEYCLGLKVPDCDFAKINVTYKAPIGAQLPQESSKWNYSICGIV